MKDISQKLDYMGTDIIKEEYYCPNEDSHLKIIESKLRDDPTICPICANSGLSEEVDIFKEAGDTIIKILEYCNYCNIHWVFKTINPNIIFDIEQLNDLS